MSEIELKNSSKIKLGLGFSTINMLRKEKPASALWEKAN